jgi:hypothetical protein
MVATASAPVIAVAIESKDETRAKRTKSRKADAFMPGMKAETRSGAHGPAKAKMAKTKASRRAKPAGGKSKDKSKRKARA